MLTINYLFQQRLTKDTSVHVVIGNEACDLDSAVAALVYAFYLYKVIRNDIIIKVCFYFWLSYM